MEALRIQGVQDTNLNIVANIQRFHSYVSSPQEKKKITYQERPMLFIVCLEEVFKLADCEGLGMRINTEYHKKLLVCKQHCQLRNIGDDLQEMIQELKQEIVTIWWKINKQNTNVIFNSLARKLEFTLASQPLKSVQEYVYLGQLLATDPDHEKEICKIIKIG